MDSKQNPPKLDCSDGAMTRREHATYILESANLPGNLVELVLAAEPEDRGDVEFRNLLSSVHGIKGEKWPDKEICTVHFCSDYFGRHHNNDDLRKMLMDYCDNRRAELSDAIGRLSAVCADRNEIYSMEDFAYALKGRGWDIEIPQFKPRPTQSQPRPEKHNRIRPMAQVRPSPQEKIAKILRGNCVPEYLLSDLVSLMFEVGWYPINCGGDYLDSHFERRGLWEAFSRDASEGAVRVIVNIWVDIYTEKEKWEHLDSVWRFVDKNKNILVDGFKGWMQHKDSMGYHLSEGSPFLWKCLSLEYFRPVDFIDFERLRKTGKLFAWRPGLQKDDDSSFFPAMDSLSFWLSGAWQYHFAANPVADQKEKPWHEYDARAIIDAVAYDNWIAEVVSPILTVVRATEKCDREWLEITSAVWIKLEQFVGLSNRSQTRSVGPRLSSVLRWHYRDCFRRATRAAIADSAQNPMHDFALTVWVSCFNDPLKLGLKRRRALRTEAKKILGKIRPILREANYREPIAVAAGKKALEANEHRLEDAVAILACLPPDLQTEGYLWDLLEQLLLCIRASATPTVNSDLRWYFDLGFDEPPRPWCFFTENFAYSFHEFARREERGDSELKLLRWGFCQFCLNRLKSRGAAKDDNHGNDLGSSEIRALKDDDMIEPNPVWRYRYVRAIMELRINPHGKGHHILHWSKQYDPDELVRKTAEDAYDLLRQRPLELNGIPHRRTVMRAFWHLRWAHLEALKVEIDERGARRTFEREKYQTS